MGLNILKGFCWKVTETDIKMCTRKRYCKNLWKYLRTNNVVCCLIRSKDLIAYVDIYVARDKRILAIGVVQTAWNPVNPSQHLRERKESVSATEYHLFTKGEATGRRQKRGDREKSFTKKRNTLSNDSKHWSKLQFIDCMQKSLKLHYAPWHGLSYDCVSIPRLLSATRLWMNDKL
jgi:hypothetical protein